MSLLAQFSRLLRERLSRQNFHVITGDENVVRIHMTQFCQRSYSHVCQLYGARPYLANCLTATVIMGVGDAIAQKIERSGKLDRRRLTNYESADVLFEYRGQRRSPSEAVSSSTMNFHCYGRSFVMCTYAFGFFAPACVWLYRKVARIPFEKIGVLQRGSVANLRVNIARAAVANMSMSIPFNVVFFSYATSLEYCLGVGGNQWAERRLTELNRAEAADGGEFAEDDLSSSSTYSWMQDLSHTFHNMQRLVADRLEACLLPTVMKSACFWIPVTTVNFQCVPAAYRVVYTSVAAVAWNTALSLIQHN